MLRSRGSVQIVPRLARSFGTGKGLPYNYGIRVVPHQSAWVVERFGKFSHVLQPGLRFLIPLVDRIAYVHNLKEIAVKIPHQTAITMDNVTIDIDGVLYLKVINAELASYGVEDVFFAMTQLAQTTMRSELGKITLDKTFAERETLNNHIVTSINSAAKSWGIECLRYEIRDITPPASVKHAMDMQAEAERRKRVVILDSEGRRQAQINDAEGSQQAAILKAKGEAEAVKVRAHATAAGIAALAHAVQLPGGSNAVSLNIAEQYMKAFGNLAKQSTTLMLPSNVSDPSSFIAQAVGIFKSLTPPTSPHSSSSSSLSSSSFSSSAPSSSTSQQSEQAAIETSDQILSNDAMLSERLTKSPPDSGFLVDDLPAKPRHG